MTDENYINSGGGLNNFVTDVNLYQTGLSVMHVPSGLFIYGTVVLSDLCPNSCRSSS